MAGFDPKRFHAATKHDKENTRAARRAEKVAKRYARVKQTPSLWPDAPADVAGVARVLSNGGRIE